MAIDIKAVVRTAVQAACVGDWGYEAEEALDYLHAIDPDRDWTQELFEAELETGHRTMGPCLPPSGVNIGLTEANEILKATYLPAIKEWLSKPHPFLTHLR